MSRSRLSSSELLARATETLAVARALQPGSEATARAVRGSWILARRSGFPGTCRDLKD